MATAGPDAPRVVAGKRMGPMCRLFGSRGIDGDGLEFELANVDPFLLCDYVVFDGTAMQKPPFGAHPHAGTAVASVLCEGNPMMAWDNINGYEKEKLYAGGVYVVCTGRGCVHDEGNDPDGIEASCAPFALPGGTRPATSFRFFQLWFDAGHIHSGDLPLASTTVVRPEAVPVTKAGALRVRVLLGRYGDCCGVDVPPTVLHGAILPLEGPGVVQVPAGAQGFLVAMCRSAKVTIAGTSHVVASRDELLLPVHTSGYEMIVEPAVEDEDMKPEEPLEVLIGFGQPIGKPFFKLLGYGGAVVAASEEEARAFMLQYEERPRHFGVPEGAEPADSTHFGLQQGYKDPMDGRGECQRLNAEVAAPEARFYELERGPFQPKGKGKGK